MWWTPYSSVGHSGDSSGCCVASGILDPDHHQVCAPVHGKFALKPEATGTNVS